MAGVQSWKILIHENKHECGIKQELQEFYKKHELDQIGQPWVTKLGSKKKQIKNFECSTDHLLGASWLTNKILRNLRF